jgi:hypothetical protein
VATVKWSLNPLLSRNNDFRYARFLPTPMYGRLARAIPMYWIMVSTVSNLTKLLSIPGSE